MFVPHNHMYTLPWIVPLMIILIPLFFSGLGVARKYSTALSHFQLAGHQGHTRALFNLAQMHLNGLGTIRSCTIGVKLVC